MRLILFDVDGTLIDSKAIIHESMRLTFQRWGYGEPSCEATRALIGLTLDTAIASLLSREVDDEILAMVSDYKDIYLQLSQQPEMQSLPFGGITAMVDRLARRNDVMLGLATGKSRRGVQKMLQTPHFSGRFTVSRSADDCPSKPHPAMVLECCDEAGVSPANTLVIGDTSFDMEMATAARATGIGVAWGYHPTDRMLSAGACAVAHSSLALQKMVDDWLDGTGWVARLSAAPDLAALREGYRR